MADANTQLKVNFSEALTDKLVSVEDALPKEFAKARFVQNCLTVVTDHPELQKYGATQLIGGCLKAAYMGLDLAQGDAYLIPYGNKLNFQSSYRGDIKFTKAYSTRPIRDIYAKVVRQGDEFIEKIDNGSPTIDFKPLPFNDGDVVGAFAVCLFADGGMIYETMSLKQIQAVRQNYSSAKDSKAWKVSFDEMAKKTILRRLCKHIDKNVDSAEALKAYEEGSGMEFANRPVTEEIVSNPFETKEEENVIDVEASDVPEDFDSITSELPFR